MIVAIGLPTVFLVLMADARRRLRRHGEIAAVRLDRRARQLLGLDGSALDQEQGASASFRLVCRDGRPGLRRGSNTSDAADLGIEVALLTNSRGAVVGVEFGRGDLVVTRHAFGQ